MIKIRKVVDSNGATRYLNIDHIIEIKRNTQPMRPDCHTQIIMRGSDPYWCDDPKNWYLKISPDEVYKQLYPEI